MKILRGGLATRHKAPFTISRPFGQDNHVLLLLRAKAEYLIEEKQYFLEPGYAVIIAPNTHYSYHNLDAEYTDDWLHFKLEAGEHLTDSLTCNIPFLLDDFETCSTLIRQILWEEAYTSPMYAGSNISALFQVLSNHLAAACCSQENIEIASPYLSQFKLLRLQIQGSLAEDHSVKRHAAELCISASHFQHLYSQFFGISFNSDLIRMRIAEAEVLLSVTPLSMEEIAAACGYTNSVHFFRQFKQMKGITPAKYRKMMPSPEKYE